MNQVREGQCFCGSLRYRMHGRPMFVHCCHCKDCQRQSGSAFAINGLIEADRIELNSGQPVAHAMPTDSGRPHDIYRCEACQTAVWSDYGKRSWLRFVRLATLENPGDFVPDVQIYTRSKLPWVVLPEGAAIFDEYYDSRAQWSAESMERLRQAKANAALQPAR